MQQEWKHVTINVLHNKKDRTECGSCGGISLVPYAAYVLLKIVAHRLVGNFCEETDECVPEEQRGFGRHRSTTDMMFVVRRLQELGRASKVLDHCVLYRSTESLYASSVDRRLLWEVVARYGVPPRIITIMCMFHDGMRARVQLSSSSELSVWFHVCQGLRQGYVSSTLLFNIFGEVLVDVIVQWFVADPESSSQT